MAPPRNGRCRFDSGVLGLAEPGESAARNQSLANQYRGKGLAQSQTYPRSDPSDVARLLSLCPAHQPTPLLDAPALAKQIGCASLRVKDERSRMGLGSFKALGAAFAIAREAEKTVQGDAWGHALAGRTFIAASAGNHGLSVAAGASGRAAITFSGVCKMDQ